ncbi:ABC transporter [Undibacterium sp. KW1]|uniref:ABC transporter ATP-binding protein n=1 Tax=Undibacterium sp. KW1 TaxID=2058624 RepID=UPI001331D9D5|nr:ABC transporter ATP-binding protein [Undibacterium sp. KW1]BBB61899.1 ABC transporter [Undibacterium sp. KW1]
MQVHLNAPVHIQGLSKSFSGQAVLKNLDWQIAPGSIVGLLGRNGAGKSTLIECLLGLRDIDGGKSSLYGEAAGQLSAETRARIAYVPQCSDLFEWLTARQMLAYFQLLYPRWNDSKVQSLMQAWELPYDKAINKLSVGQKQRLSIIRALAHDPELLILDEPVSSLDPAGRREFLRELIDRVIEKQTTIVFSTHILSDLERVAMDVAFLNGGQIVHQQSLDDMMDNTVRVIAAPAVLQELQPTKILRQSTTAKDGDAAEGKMLAQFSHEQLQALQVRRDVRLDKLSLEDLFIEMTL